MPEKTPKTPSYDVRSILKTQAQISGPAWLDFYGTRVQGDDFETFARHAHSALPPSVRFPVVYQSLTPFAGQDLTPAMGDEAAWRLAGNVHRLKKGVPVYPWKGQIEAESVPLLVEGVDVGVRVFKRGDKEERVRGGWVKLLVLGGLPAGRRFTRFWSWKYAKFIRAEVGFSLWDRSRFTDDRKRLKTNFPFVHMRQLVQFWLLAGLEADLDPAGPKIVGDQVRATPAMVKHNHHVMNLRLRRGFECPKAWDRECHFCPLGRVSCAAACHEVDFVAGHCNLCGEANRPFDPLSQSGHCVDCPGLKV